MAVDGVPSSESRCISLSATSSPVCLLRPLNTYGISACICQYTYSVTYRRIRALSQLLQLLKRTWVSSVVHGGHDWYDLAFAEVLDTDGRVGAVGHG